MGERAPAEVRPARTADAAAIEALYPAAFPDEDLVPLVKALMGEGDRVASFVAEVGPVIAGHAAFTHCSIEGADDAVALLGPLAVVPAHQGRGIGGALVRTGLAAMAEAGVARALVLGDPAYYRRFGFRPERRVAPPYELPAGWRDAWQSVSLAEASGDLAGRLMVPAVWRVRAYWSD